MKSVIILSFLLLFTACSSNEKKQDTPSKGKYLSKEDVITLFDDEPIKDAFDEEASADDLLRLDTLTPENEFFAGFDTLKEATLPADTIDPSSDVRAVEAIDYRQFAQPVVSQWNGTCTAHATAAMVEGLYKMKTGKDLKLSERHLWDKYGKYNAKAAMDAMAKNYIASDKYWPHKSTKPITSKIDDKGVVKIPHYYYIGDDSNKLLEGMSRGMMGKIAMRVPYDMIKCRKIIRDTSAPVEGGHDIAIYGIIPSEKHGLIAILKNSWGESCADGGYQYLQLSICKKQNYYCMLFLIDEIKERQ